jgi:hypothetical protein
VKERIYSIFLSTLRETNQYFCLNYSIIISSTKISTHCPIFYMHKSTFFVNNFTTILKYFYSKSTFQYIYQKFLTQCLTFLFFTSIYFLPTNFTWKVQHLNNFTTTLKHFHSTSTFMQRCQYFLIQCSTFPYYSKKEFLTFIVF